ncbi:hypothetical protein HPB51_015048 [Rhipicephalus microplus]|uniref:Multiple inositol polyphosphate phosphatase 1 n=1 Tax=Rhipicephalus microplus TaxID=6941 RepID=A0A9J6ETB3_RHIMP|nr:hypothetical protein HPB51_015048 [Rhipicephalus microplus]
MDVEIILSIVAGFLTGMATAEAPCYKPRDRDGQCRHDPYRLPSVLFGTKTTYRHATGLHTKWAQQARVPGCRPLLLMIFMRHTTRFPSKKDLKKFERRLPELQSMILSASRANSASRFQGMFPGLLPSRFYQDEYFVRATSKNRTQDTAYAFLKAVLNRKGRQELEAPYVHGFRT